LGLIARRLAAASTAIVIAEFCPQASAMLASAKIVDRNAMNCFLRCERI
jgi:hypothetical protein